MSPADLRITNGQLALTDGPQTGGVHMRGGRIHRVVANSGTAPSNPAATSNADQAADHATAVKVTTIDVDGLIVAPGFIDLQVNGGSGIDLTSELLDNPERLWELGATLPTQGVTAFLPTIVSAPASRVEAALAALHSQPPDYLGAVAMGVHAEGPMIAPAKRGTHDPAHLRDPDPALISGWSRDAGVAMVTIAPELPGATDLIAHLAERGVVVSIGHTAATYEQAIAGLDAGAVAATHLGNAMSGFTAREPGAIGALLADTRATVGLIVDGVHLHPGTVAALWRALGPTRVALVTDAIAAAGTSSGRARLGGRHVTIADGAVRDDEGALAGSIVTMDRALRELVAATGTDPFCALHAASATPAELLGADDRGYLEVGARADLVVLTPDLQVVATFVGGRLAAHPRPDRLPLPSELGTVGHVAATASSPPPSTQHRTPRP